MNFFAMFWAWSVSTRDLVDEVGIDGGVAAFGGFVDSGSGLPSSRARRARATCGLVARGWAPWVVERVESYLRIGCGYD